MESAELAIPMLLADFPQAIAHYFNRHGIYDRSAFALMHEMHMEALKETWLPGINTAVTGEEYFELVDRLLAARKVHEKIVRDNNIDVLLYPSTKIPNMPNDGADVMSGTGPLGNELSELSIGANMMYSPSMRTPSISLFSGMDAAGLPLSVTFDALSGDDRKLLDVAEALEKVLPRLEEPKSI